MNLRILIPTRLVLEVDTPSITAEGSDGSFVLLPRHIDYVAELVPGILTYESPEGKDHFVAVDEGILVKVGPEVTVSVNHAVVGHNLGELENTIEQQFQALDEQQKKTRVALSKLEADFVRQFIKLGK